MDNVMIETAPSSFLLKDVYRKKEYASLSLVTDF
jgi:hypothetical protein